VTTRSTSGAAPANVEAPAIGELLANALLRGRTGADTALLRATIERLCRDRADGHVCLRLDELADTPRDDGAPPWPQLAQWTAALRGSGLCDDGNGAEPRPLVLDAASRLYLRRDFAAERTIRDWLLPRLAPRGIDPRTVAAALRAAGAVGAAEPQRSAEPDWQLAAVTAAARAPFLVLTGGPGTGKTTTVARLLAVLRTLEPGLRVAVAAPTGKAAARLGEALQQLAPARGATPPTATAPANAPVPTTLHRLLGYLPLDDAFRAGPMRPLPYDLVVVDEASMVDPALLATLCSALPADARLVLVGDRDQLAAVAAGQVLGDLCRAARPERGVTAELAAFVREATGLVLPVQPDAGALAGAVVALRTSHRFGAQPGIGAFATALAARDAAAALAALRRATDDLVLVDDAEAALQRVAPALLACAAAAAGGTGEQALAALATVRVLCASRHGAHGAAQWNRRIEQLLARHGHRVDAVWYPGRPVLVTANDHQNRLWNGDLGVTVADADGRPLVAFATARGGVRTLPPLRLPAHETAWAMTVHKAQGSEFDQVLLAMPDRPGPLWQAPLLYTGVTRAKRAAVVLAASPLLEQALANWPHRSSGLADAFAPPPPAR
jgi:exodeoxyribonuclease V alpha subunit